MTTITEISGFINTENILKILTGNMTPSELTVTQSGLTLDVDKKQKCTSQWNPPPHGTRGIRGTSGALDGD
jgi:hypothetical protein